MDFGSAGRLRQILLNKNPTAGIGRLIPRPGAVPDNPREKTPHQGRVPMLKRIVRRFLTPAVVLAVSIGFIMIPANAREPIEAHLSASPGHYVGKCPGKITFTGKIMVHSPRITRVQYRFIRSDGASAPVQTWTLQGGPAEKTVSTTWTIGRDYTGWMAIKVIYPRTYESNKANFTIKCATKLEPRPGMRPVKPGVAGGMHLTPRPGPEDCVSFNPATTTVKQINGHWKIVDGSHWMFDFGSNQAEARKALSIIKHYRMNRSCFVGRPNPSFKYMLVNGHAPTGAMSGEDCVSFNPATIQVKKINGSWKIVDGSHWMFDFGSNEAEARQAFAIIKKYGFTRSCFVGRPGPSFEYLRK
jgi:hypothetical protein